MPTATSTTPAITEKALAARLKGIPKSELKGLADAINKLGAGGFKPDDIFPIGIIINNPDGVEVRGHMSPTDILALPQLMPTINPKAVTIFPRGIVAPDKYRVHIKLNHG
jgi:hypothetical protein